jgi:UPF0755 protein
MAPAADGPADPHGPEPAVFDEPGEADTAAEARARPRRGAAGRDRRRRRRTYWRRRILLLAGLVLLAAIGVGAWYRVQAHPSGHEGPGVVIDVHRGEATDTLAGDLAAHGVIASPLAFHLWTLLHGAPSPSPGAYYLHKNSSFAAASTALGAGPDVNAVDVVPGLTLTEVAHELTVVSPTFASGFLAAAKSGAVPSPFQSAAGATLEGLLGTGSYQIVPGEQPATLLRHMVSRFDAEAATAGLTAQSAGSDGLTTYQVVVLASIAQKEGYYDRYLGDVARTIYNRLHDGIHLDMTSTVLYSFGQDGGTVTPAEEATTTPYNTYLHGGLTPTPICVPSEAALAAAVAPPPGPWLYFELTTATKGVLVFSATYTGQLAAEAQAAANASQHPGSS